MKRSHVVTPLSNAAEVEGARNDETYPAPTTENAEQRLTQETSSPSAKHFQSSVLVQLRLVTEQLAAQNSRIEGLEASNKQLRATVQALREANSIEMAANGSSNILQALSIINQKTKKEEAVAIAEELYSYHSSNHKSNLLLVDKFLEEKGEFFDPFVKICPSFNILMSHVMVNKIGISVKSVRHTIKIGHWSERDAMRVGSSLAVFLRKRKTGDAALHAWRLHYVQLKKLFDEAEGCEEFMLVFANNLLRDR